jgi:hypothetical protein
VAEFCLKDAYLTVAATELSDHLVSVDFSVDQEMLDKTAMGDDWREHIGGLLSAGFSAKFNQDFASSDVAITIWTAFIGGVAVAIALLPVNTTIAATNPEYQFNALVKTYPPLGGDVGSLAQTQVTFQPTGAVTRDVSP